MAIQVDDAANIDRIIDILKSDKTIFNKTAPSRELLRKIIFADPEAGHTDDSTPYAWVSVRNKFKFTRETVGSDRDIFLQSLAEYQIVVVAHKKDPAESFRELSRFIDLIVEVLRKNPTLKDPSTGTDPKAKRMNIVAIEKYTPEVGKSQDAVRIVVGYQIGTEWQLVLPNQGPLTIDLISKPRDDTGVVPVIDIGQNGQACINGVPDPRPLEVEFESTEALDTTLNALINTRDTIHIVHDTTTTVISNAFFLERRAGFPYDNKEKTILAFLIP